MKKADNTSLNVGLPLAVIEVGKLCQSIIYRKAWYRLILTWVIAASCLPATQPMGSATSNSPISPPKGESATASLEMGPGESEASTTVTMEYIIYLPTITAISPASILRIGPTTPDRQSVPAFEKFELTFPLEGSVATQPDFPYDPSPPPGLPGRIGVTVEALFLPPGQTNWSQALIQPAFRYQPFQRLVSGDGEGLYPIGNITWMVRFAPQITGTWQYKLRAQDASTCPVGLAPCPYWAESNIGSFKAAAPLLGDHGFVRISPSDSRYFEFSDGTPFLGLGHQTSFGSSTQVEKVFDTYKNNGVNFLRTWLSATGVYSLGFPSWDTWANSMLVFSPVYPGSEVSARIASEGDSPCIFQGFGEGAKSVIKGGKTYTLIIRAKTENIKGPRVAGKPYGLVVKVGTWPKGLCGNPNNGLQTLSPYWNSTSDWTDYTATFSLPQDVILGMGQFFTVALENTLDGQVYIDRVSVTETPSGPNILVHGDMNYHLYFDQASSWRWDYILDRAAERDIFLKLVILEKHDGILSFIRPDGSVASEPDDNFFYGLNMANPDQPTKVRRLQEYFWRYLSARWGYSTAVHSWELLNEGDPFNGNHYDQAEALSKTIRATDPSQHLVTTSFWHSFPVKEFWANPDYPDLDYADFHAYIATTWLQAPNDIRDPVTKQKCGSDQICYVTAMRDDTALYHTEHSLNVRMRNPGKPVVRGEAGITELSSDANPDPDLIKDTQGTWLHKLLFAQVNPGGLYELYWYADTIIANNLYPIFRRYRDFMVGIPINSGDFVDLAASMSNSNLRVLGQKDPANQRAFLWIDNRNHTWRQVVNGASIPSISGVVQIGGFQPNTDLPVQWWNTCSGQPPVSCIAGIASTGTVRADNTGKITLEVTNLANDVAVKIGIFPPGGY